MDTSNGVLLSATHDGSVRTSQKRPRPVLSCLQCKRKKLKCDRQNPCLQCLKSGRAAQCTYNDSSSSAPPPEQAQDVAEPGRPAKLVRLTPVDEHSGHVSDNSPASRQWSAPVARIGVIEDLQSRVEKLEQQLATRSRALSSEGIAYADHPFQGKPYSVSSMGVLHFKGSSIRYHGKNQKVALLSHVSSKADRSLLARS